MDLEFREWLIGFVDIGYIVLYLLEGDLAVVLAVRHQKKSGPSLNPDRSLESGPINSLERRRVACSNSQSGEV